MRCSQPQRGPLAMKDLRRGYVWTESPLKTSCSGTQTRQVAVSAHVGVCTSLKPFCCVRNVSPCCAEQEGVKRGKRKKKNNTHARTQYKHIREDSWTARQPLSSRFRFYVTVTHIQCSVQRHFLHLWRGRRKGQSSVCRQPPCAFLRSPWISLVEWEGFILLPFRKTKKQNTGKSLIKIDIMEESLMWVRLFIFVQVCLLCCRRNKKITIFLRLRGEYMNSMQWKRNVVLHLTLFFVND